MEPLTIKLARELAEEIRTNNKLRHRLGLEEGSEAGLLDDGSATVALQTKEGNFFITVEEA